MLLGTAISTFNRWAGPALVRQALKTRAMLGVWEEAPWLDALLLHPPVRILTVEVHHQYREQPPPPPPPPQPAGKHDDNDNDERVRHHRLAILESQWRKAGLTNPRLWPAWSLHGPFKKLLRAEVMWGLHGTHVQQSLLGSTGLAKSPQLRPHRHSIFPFLDRADSADSGECVRLSHLPTSRQLVQALDLADWTIHKDTRATTRAMRRLSRRVGGTFYTLRGGALCVSELSEGTTTEANTTSTAAVPLSFLSFVEVVELAGGHVHYCGPLNALCERHDIYQIWTRDYVQHLGAYLEDRVSSLLAAAEKTTVEDGDRVERPTATLLDVGAGDGLLVQLLGDYFARRSSSSPRRASFHPRVRQRPRSPLESAAAGASPPPPSSVRIEVVATDDGSWNVSPKAPVERLSVEQALDKYAPVLSSSADTEEESDRCRNNHSSSTNNIVIVLCSWMPQSVDWTELFRRHGVDEYVLIGECDDGQCGDNWSTWGNPHFFDDDPNLADGVEKDPPETEGTDGSDLEPPSSSVLPPPFVVDGYERIALDALAPHQFSRFDCRVSKSGRTVSFRRRRSHVVHNHHHRGDAPVAATNQK